jgi:glycosyltransferase involved in cell wall biosynthesis
MRLLVVTQAVDQDDPALGFFHPWLEELSRHFDTVEVICLKEGRHALPERVRVHSLGKPSSAKATKDREPSLPHFFLRMRYVWRFYTLLWRLRGRYDAVFVHMNPEYVVLAGLLWRVLGKRIVLWYTHRLVNTKLRTAVRLANAVATAAPESLRLASRKVQVIGHGIETRSFATVRDGELHDPIAIVSVGRITPIKRLELLIEALALLSRQDTPVELTLVGAPTVGGDVAYERMLRAKAHELGIEKSVHFSGAIPYREMPALYGTQDISVNLAPTGGIDKAVLESMASGCLVLVANKAFAPLLGLDAHMLTFEPTPADLASKLTSLVQLTSRDRLALSCRLVERARNDADLAPVVNRLATLLT